MLQCYNEYDSFTKFPGQDESHGEWHVAVSFVLEISRLFYRPHSDLNF